MTAYLTSLLGASLVVALVNLMAPPSAAKVLRLVTSLFLVCALIAPLPSAFERLGELTDDWESILEGDGDSAYADQMQEALDHASRAYFVQALTQMLEQRFEIKTGDVRCAVEWDEGTEAHRPKRITVILSGSAIWKNPAEIEQFVSSLLSCTCVSAIE